MEVKGFLRKFVAIIAIVAIVLPSFSTVMAYSAEDLLGKTGDTANFGISLIGKDGWGYKVQNRKVYRIYEGNKNYSRNLYCLDFTKNFPTESSSTGKYTNKGDYTGANKERLALMAENMYITTMDQTDKDRILSNMFADLIERTKTDANAVTLDYIKKTLTEDDIVFAQQCAIWKYTNNQTWQGASIWMTTKENPSDTDWYQISNIGQARYGFMQEIYNYLTGSKLKSESSVTNPSLTKASKTSTEVADGYIVGPFHIKSGTNTNYTVKITDQSGSEISGYKLVDKNGNRLSTTLENTLNRDFYVKVPLRTMATKVVLSLSYNSYKTTKTSWISTSSGSQPLLEITRERVPGSDKDEAPIEKPEKIYDLALRKYIVKVGNTNITDRIPNITYNKSDKEINYKHKKDPIVLNPGDTVVYNITVYNEGNQKGTATRVKDYLPEGLEFIKNSDLNRQYGWIASQDGKYIVTAYPRNYPLEPYNENTNKISSVTMQVECKVKDTFKSGVLTNLAEIVEDNIEDIDSVPGSINIDGINLPDYKGKDSNKDDLTDKSYYYRGQEDDDDFEKVVVKDVKLDLSLRKYITTVNGENQNREPKVDVTPLVNKSATTAIYTHSKTPVTVKKGDIVIYSIRVYNEGDEDAYANEVTDYLPEELGLLVNHNINYDNGWKVQGQSKIVKLNTIENATKNLTTSDFRDITSLDDVDVVTGKATIKTNKLQYGNTNNLIKAFDSSKKELSSKVLQVACVVLTDELKTGTIKNIAAVTAEVDKDGTPREDRDSQPTEIDLANYPDNTNIQDDDDFEKLIINKKFDLSLRKFITAINGEERTDRIPQVSYTNGEFVYTHPKDAIIVEKGNIVTYTLRVYNEGELAGYASLIEDNIPEGLKYLPEHQTNKDYGWKMYDSDGKEVTDASKAVTIKTDYRSFEKNKTENLIPAFVSGKPSFVDVKVAFEVIEDNNSDKTIVNTAEIADDQDENGKPIEDVDSVPSNHKENEDDIDKEYLKLKPGIYDLAIIKFLSSVEGKDITPSRLRSVDTKPLQEGKTDAIYNLVKDLVKVANSSRATYTIRVYNEGTVDAVVEEVRDSMPEGLEFIKDSEINKEFKWKEVDGQLRTDYTNGKTIKAFNKETGEIDYIELRVEFKLVAKEVKIIENVAEITADNGEDIDSTPDNNKPEEDDQDYDRIIPAIYDLALKKFITKVDGENVKPSREPKVNVKPLQDGKTDAEYTLSKTPVKVKKDSNVVYTIRVYNEGELDAYAEEVRDNLPEGLEFVKDSEINKQYRWKEKDGQVYTDYLSKEVNPDKVIKAFDKENGKISYQDVQIEFKVVSSETKAIRNIAEVTDDNGEDTDSTPNNDNPEEDDQDYEDLIPTIYDLALRKFITKINDKTITSRIPMVSVDENGELTYNNSKEPLTVTNKSVIVYTIRVYNEGTTSAWVEEVRDNMPDGLVYLPNHEINKKYGWKLYDENGNETEDVSKAKQIKTRYLSKEESASRDENNELKPFDKETGVTSSNPDYRDVEVAFEVDQSKMGINDRKIVNIAEITDDNGDDIDSTPDNDIPEEDDQDYEEVELKYFDLSLVKYVTQVIVNENGTVKKIDTGHTGNENPEPVVKVELNRKILNKTQVSYIYRIKVTNEGEIEGYAKEIKDRIPAGLEFYADDNPGWKISEDGVVTTDLLKDTLLKPGESAEVTIVLRWKNEAKNLGLKVNTAEISKDENEYGTPDIDSTPDNNVDGEDDQDTAPVILSVSTGAGPTYIVLTITIMTLFATGCYSIKKFVLDK